MSQKILKILPRWFSEIMLENISGIYKIRCNVFLSGIYGEKGTFF